MNPTNSNQVPAMELPEPVKEAQTNTPEQFHAGPVTETGAAQAIEQGVAGSDPGQQQSTTDDPTQLDITRTLPINPAFATNPAPTTTNLPAIADDNDLIEKEWVQKAKQIVESTHDDPHLQNKEMSKMRADYLKKRYNKEVKLVEE